MAHVRQFDTGATRDPDASKPDYEGYLSPLVIERYGRYMLSHQETPAGPRASDNWQLGIPQAEYLKSAQRHNLDLWLLHRGYRGVYTQDVQDALCALLFNISGYLHEELKAVKSVRAVMDRSSEPD